MSKKKPKKDAVQKNVSHTRLIFKARQDAVALTKELTATVNALRHSNAVAAYVVLLMEGTVKIPLEAYKKLIADDTTAIHVAYEHDEAVIRVGGTFVKDEEGKLRQLGSAMRTTHLEALPPIGQTIGDMTVTDTPVEPEKGA